MSDLLSMGMVILVICIIASRAISRDALTRLTDDEKQRLARQIDGFKATPLIPLLSAFGAYLVLTWSFPSFYTPAFVILILAFIGYLFWTFARVVGRMKAADLPDEYIRQYRQSRWVYNLGFTLCGAILLLEMM